MLKRKDEMVRTSVERRLNCINFGDEKINKFFSKEGEI